MAALPTTNQPGTINRLSLHVEPILLPIATLYWLHDGPEPCCFYSRLSWRWALGRLFALAHCCAQRLGLPRSLRRSFDKSHHSSGELA
ncbi:MAG: hypothetical protein R2867_30130 [Caldilineaceae bacterium]